MRIFITKKQLWLSLYALLNLSAVLIFLTIVYKTQTDAIMEFPVNLVTFFINLNTYGLDMNFITLANTAALLFYILLFRFILTLPGLTKLFKINLATNKRGK